MLEYLEDLTPLFKITCRPEPTVPMQIYAAPVLGCSRRAWPPSPPRNYSPSVPVEAFCGITGTKVKSEYLEDLAPLYEIISRPEPERMVPSHHQWPDYQIILFFSGFLCKVGYYSVWINWLFAWSDKEMKTYFLDLSCSYKL